MQIMPILSTLRRHRTAAVLIVLEIALTCAIVCNAIFLIRERLAQMDRPSGIVEDELVHVQITGIGARENADALMREDIVALRSIPGVKSVLSTNMIPFGGSSWNSSISTKPDDRDAPINAGMYMGTGDFVGTYGLQLLAGRTFNADEFVAFDDVQTNKKSIPSVIVTRAVAEKLYPDQNALGKPIYVMGTDPPVIVGIVEHIVRPNDANGIDQRPYSMIMPIDMPFTFGGHYVMRVDPARKAEVLKAVDAKLDAIDPRRIMLENNTFTEIRAKYFEQDKAMAMLLVGVSIALLIITALGVVGLASFWVQQRTRTIGIRRALGATKQDIRRYFQLENFILATMGIVVGMALAYGVNMWLMDKYGVHRLSALYLPIGALLLWALGQLAVLGPAVRASSIPPAVATRSV
jgi:putative ABC transport system permease protein